MARGQVKSQPLIKDTDNVENPLMHFLPYSVNVEMFALYIFSRNSRF